MNGLEYIIFIKGVSHQEVADHLEVSPQQISHFVKGRRSPSPPQLTSLEQYFNIPKTYFTKELTGKDRIEIEVLLGATHDNTDLSRLLQENNNLRDNFGKLLKRYEHLAKIKNKAISILNGKE